MIEEDKIINYVQNEIPSVKLRNMIENETGLSLNSYAWDISLTNEIFNIIMDPYIEDHVQTLYDAYKYGFNIGHCGTTSRYLSRHFDNADFHVGISSLLKGTKNSTIGGHAWIEIDGYIIDPTLMIKLPINLKEKYGYVTSKVLLKRASLILSEYDIYDHEYNRLLENNDVYYKGVYKRNRH